MDTFLSILALILNGFLELTKLIIYWVVKMFNKLKKIILPQFDKAKSLRNNERKVFVFGLPHAGKSTMTAALVKFLDTDNSYVLRRDPVNNKEGVKILQEWIVSYYNGEFPHQTNEGNYQILDLEYINLTNNRNKKIILYEVAGEDVIKFDPVNDNFSEILTTELSGFLDISKYVIILAPSNPERINEDQVIRNFLEYILREKKRKKILFILTKYDLVESKYENHVQAAKEIYPGSVKLLMTIENSELLPFSVGKITGDNEFIDDSSKFIKKILGWIESQ